MKKILLALQMWEGDQDDAMALLELLIKLKPRGHYQFADVALITRFDCPDVSSGMIRRLEETFDKVWMHCSRRKEIGWPAGCNGLWHDTMHWSYEMHKLHRMDYSAILTTEADTCPLTADWDERLARVWNDGHAKVMGFWHDSGSKVGHINGNALFDPQLVSLSTWLNGCPEQVAWDTEHAPLFKQLGWAKCREIHSMWNTSTLGMDELDALRGQGVVWLHGVKDGSVRAWADLVLC